MSRTDAHVPYMVREARRDVPLVLTSAYRTGEPVEVVAGYAARKMFRRQRADAAHMRHAARTVRRRNSMTMRAVVTGREDADAATWEPYPRTAAWQLPTY